MRIKQVVTAMARRVFPRERNAVIRERTSPHNFRHYYVTSSLKEGMNAEILMQQVGYSSRRMIDKYTFFDPAWVENDIRRIDKKRGGNRTEVIQESSPGQYDVCYTRGNRTGSGRPRPTTVRSTSSTSTAIESAK